MTKSPNHTRQILVQDGSGYKTRLRSRITAVEISSDSEDEQAPCISAAKSVKNRSVANKTAIKDSKLHRPSRHTHRNLDETSDSEGEQSLKLSMAAATPTKHNKNSSVINKTAIKDSKLDRPYRKPRGRYNSNNTEDTSGSSEEYSLKLSTPAATPTKHKSEDITTASEDSATPPKQRRNDEHNLLRTPQTPSTLFNKLALHTPEKSFEPKKLFSNQYQTARKALHSTVPTQMPGRENELGELRNFIDGCLSTETSSSLYISGPPGTGKTAALSVILQESPFEDLKKVFVNCTAIKSAKAIFSRIVSELNIKCSGRTEKDSLAAIEDYFATNHKMILLVLDEIDQLDSKNQTVLYTIFEWPAKPNSKIILIGIANALDLTDRILPRLQIRCELKPKLMHFAPYSKQQLMQIFTERLKESKVPIFSPAAIQMLAGKVAAVSGDIRRALDIGRRVIELAEHKQHKAILQSVENFVSLEELKTDKPEVVDVKQVVSVLNNVYGTSQNLNDDAEDAFPLQQKIIVCCLLLILKKARNKDVTVGKLHEVYKKICQKRNLSAVDQAEFGGLCSLVETRGIIRIVGKKEPRLHKVTLEWNEEEVVAVLKDKQLMSSILQDDKCLGKL